MPSEEQREASRLNGAASRGPVTPRGKAHSSRNATTHGLTARDVVLSNENPEAYQAIEDAFTAGWCPTSDLERLLVVDLAACYWRLLRAESNETALSDLQMEADAPESARIFPQLDERFRSALAAKALTDSTGALSHLDRHSTRLSRQFDRTWKLLDRLRQGAHFPGNAAGNRANFQNEPSNPLKTQETEVSPCPIG